jgi:hypothetical protein
MHKSKPLSYASSGSARPEPRRRAYRELRRLRVALTSDVALTVVAATVVLLLLISLLAPGGSPNLEGNSSSPAAIIGPRSR